jgi:hypothetical protein
VIFFKSLRVSFRVSALTGFVLRVEVFFAISVPPASCG